MENEIRITDSSMLAGLFANGQLVGEALGIKKRRVYQLVDEGVLHKDDAKFNLVQSFHNYLTYVRSLTPEYEDGAEELQKQQIRLTKARADKAEVEADLAKGSVAELDDIAMAWESIVIEVRSRLLNIPHRATTRLVAERCEKKIKAILMDEVKSALTSLIEEPSIKGGSDVE